MHRWFGYRAVCLVVAPLVGVAATPAVAEIGIWTSARELAEIPAEGCAWDEVLVAADAAVPNAATVSDQTSDNNVEILAAAIVYAKTGDSGYRDKVVQALETLVATGEPGARTLAWARETGAYVAAADLVDYRTGELEEWLRSIAEVWLGDDRRTLLGMYKERPNNWGAHAFGALSTIYLYLGDADRLQEIHDYWRASLLGPTPPEAEYGDDLSWHPDEADLRWINPAGAEKSGLSIDGLIADDMRRNGPFAVPPPNTSPYHWEGLQGLVMAARVLDRAGRPTWSISDAALLRAVTILQQTYDDAYGGWRAAGDDLWMLPFIDEAYATDWSSAYDPCESRLFRHGKNTGWGWVTLAPSEPVRLTVSGECPGLVTLDVAGGTPDGAMAIVASPEAGTDPLSTGPCVDTETGLRTPRVVTVDTLDPNGTISLTRQAAPRRCGALLQAVDGSRCELSDIAPLPDADATENRPNGGR